MYLQVTDLHMEGLAPNKNASLLRLVSGFSGCSSNMGAPADVDSPTLQVFLMIKKTESLLLYIHLWKSRKNYICPCPLESDILRHFSSQFSRIVKGLQTGLKLLYIQRRSNLSQFHFGLAKYASGNGIVGAKWLFLGNSSDFKKKVIQQKDESQLMALCF